jgi:hypothetical protein
VGEWSNSCIKGKTFATCNGGFIGVYPKFLPPHPTESEFSYTDDNRKLTPYYDPDINIDWENVDKLQANLDGAGILGDIALVVQPEGPREVVEAGVTLVELVAAGDAVIDTAQGSPENLIQTIATNGIEKNLRLLARGTRWIPLGRISYV